MFTINLLLLSAYNNNNQLASSLQWLAINIHNGTPIHHTKHIVQIRRIFIRLKAITNTFNLHLEGQVTFDKQNHKFAQFLCHMYV